MKHPERYTDDWPAVSLAVRTEAAGQCQCTGQCGTRGSLRACMPEDLAWDNEGAAAWPRCQAQQGGLTATALRQVALYGAARYETGDRTRGRVVLTVAHLNDDPQDNTPGNLLAMCQACHLAYDRHTHRKGTP